MNFSYVRTLFLFLLLAARLLHCNAQQGMTFSNASCKVEVQQNANLKLQLEIQDFHINRKNNPYRLTVPGLTGIDSVNFPDLPKCVIPLMVSAQGIKSVKVLHVEFTDIPGCNIGTFKSGEGRGISNPPDIVNNSSENNFWPEQDLYIGKTYQLRDITGQVIYIYPFRYSKSDSVLRVYSSITVEVEFNQQISPVADKVLSKDQLYFCKRNFVNFQASLLSPAANDAMLILCPQQWIQLVQPLADWKNQSGITTEIVDVTAFANDAAAIKNYIYSYYQQHNLTHALLIGDNTFIAAPLSTAMGGPSDPSYGYISGNDSYPEVFVGRFPAENDSEVITMVQRVLEYEKSPDTTADWFTKSAGIASNLGPGDDNEMDWEHLSNIRNQLLNYSYTSVLELYDGTHPGTTDNPGNPSPSDVVNAFQSGISLLNYTGHGSGNSFNTSGFSVNDIVNLSNVGKLPIVISAGCTNGNFTTGSLCMGEAFLRSRSNGQPAGAVAAFMSAVNQYWNPPMDAQDAMNAIITENDSVHASHTFGGIVFGGCMHMNDDYGIQGALMTDTWHCFGDPSLLVRTAFPTVVTAVHAPGFTIGDTVFNITSNVQDAVVTLFQNGKVISQNNITAGSAQLFFPSITSFDSVLITVSGYNLYPYIIKLPVVPASGSFVICTAAINDDSAGNNNGLIDYDEAITAGLEFYNAGLTPAVALHMNIATPDSSVIIQNVNPVIFNLNSGDSVFILNAFGYKVKADVKDAHKIIFNVDVTDSAGQQWTSSFEEILNAPDLISSSLSVDDQSGNGNGVGEAGEDINVRIRYINAGHSDADSVYAKISTPDPALILLTDSVMFSIHAQEDTVVSFSAHVASTAAINQLAHIVSHVQSGSYSSDTIYNITTGYTTEDFESGNLSTFNWQTGGNQPWFVTSLSPAEGNFCLQSGDINDNEESTLKLLINVYRSDSLKFAYRTDCEGTWDYLEVRSDSIPYFTASGNTPWNTASFMLDTGLHVIEFIYKKDNVFSAGSDAVWIDEIRFPPFTAVSGITDLQQDKAINAYPDPASDRIFFSNILTGSGDIYIYDVNGRMVSHDIKRSGQNSYWREVTSLRNGLYVLFIKTDTSFQKVTFIVQHP
jgi:hypothetical protein